MTKKVALTKSKAAPASKPRNADDAVAESLEALVRELAKDAYTKAERSGDRAHYRSEELDLEDLYLELWEREYRWVFFSAFFALAPDRRRASATRKVATRALDTYVKTLGDEASCFAYCKKHWRTGDRLALLSFFDGESARPLEIEPFAAIRKKLAHEKL